MSTNYAGIVLAASEEVAAVKKQDQVFQGAYMSIMERFTEVLIRHGLLHALGELQATAASNPAAARFQEGLNSAMKAVALPSVHLIEEDYDLLQWAMHVEGIAYRYAKPFIDHYLTFLKDSLA